MARCTYISKLLIFRVVCLRCLLLRRCSTAAVFSDCVVLLRLTGVVSINWDICLLDFVFGLLPLAAVIIVLVHDHVLRAGAVLLTAGLSWACCLLRALLLANSLFLSGGSCCSILVVLSSLGIAVRGTLGICGMSLAIFHVIRLSLNVCAVCNLGDAWARLGFCTACSISLINFCSSSSPSLLPMFLMALLQSAMAAIIFLAWVMVSLVML